MTEKLSDLLKLHQESCELASRSDNDVVLDQDQLADLSQQLDEAIKIVKAWEDAPTESAVSSSQPPMRAVTGIYFHGPDVIPLAGRRYKLVEVE